MKKYTLKATKREDVGRKVKRLRLEGKLPATVYGKKLTSENLIVSTGEFTKVFSTAGETGLIELEIDGKVKPVLIHHVQKDPVKETLLHVEFHQVDLKEKVHASVPLVLIGESPVVAQKAGVVLNLLSDVEVEALPTDLPEKIEVDVTALSEVGQELKVSDLHFPEGVTVITEGTVGVVKVGALVSKAAEEQAAQEAAAASTATEEAGADATEGAEESQEPVSEKPSDEEKKPDAK